MATSPDDIDVASPCEADWNEMSGDARVRFCGHCGKHVHNLSAMSRDEAEALVDSAGAACVRFYRAEDGTVWTAGRITRPPVGRRALFAFGWRASVTALLLSLGPRAEAEERKKKAATKAIAAPTNDAPRPHVTTLQSILDGRHHTTMKDVLEGGKPIEIGPRRARRMMGAIRIIIRPDSANPEHSNRK